MGTLGYNKTQRATRTIEGRSPRPSDVRHSRLWGSALQQRSEGTPGKAAGGWESIGTRLVGAESRKVLGIAPTQHGPRHAAIQDRAAAGFSVSLGAWARTPLVHKGPRQTKTGSVSPARARCGTSTARPVRARMLAQTPELCNPGPQPTRNIRRSPVPPAAQTVAVRQVRGPALRPAASGVWRGCLCYGPRPKKSASHDGRSPRSRFEGLLIGALLVLLR